MEQSYTQETAKYISAILEQTPNGILLVDKETRIQYVNPSFLEMFHCEDEEILEQPAAQFVHSDCFERAIAEGGKLMVKESMKRAVDACVKAGIGLTAMKTQAAFSAKRIIMRR